MIPLLDLVGFIKGNGHEVYDVAPARGSAVIVRIARQTEHGLEAER